MRNIIATLALIASTAAALAHHDEKPAPRTCPDVVSCWLTQTTRFECGTNDPFLCWFGEYRDPSKPLKPSIKTGW